MAGVEYPERAELAELASRLKHQQIESLRMLSAAAIAAAGQVRDTRLDRLENPSPPPNTNLWFDLLFEVALFPIAGAAISKLAKSVARGIVAIRLAPTGKLLAAARANVNVAWFPMAYRDDLNKVIDEAEAVLMAHEKRLNDYWGGFAKGVAGDVFGVAKKRVDPRVPDRLPFKWPFPPENDSPASMVEESVLLGAARQELAIGFSFDQLLIHIHNPDLTPEQVKRLRVLLTGLIALTGVDPAEVRRLRLYYETCIWCLMYRRIATVLPAEPIMSEPGVGDGQPVEVDPGKPRVQLLIDAELATYLVRRLPHPKSQNMESFANYALTTSAAPLTQEVAAGEARRRAEQAGGDTPVEKAAALLSAVAEVGYEQQLARAAEGDPILLGKDGNPLREPLLIRPAAYLNLAYHFQQLSTRMDKVRERLETQPAMIYPTPDASG